MSFIEELQMLTKTYKSAKLEDVKEKLKLSASKGESMMTLDGKFYDDWVIKWLIAQGLEVEEVNDQRNGEFIKIRWTE